MTSYTRKGFDPYSFPRKKEFWINRKRSGLVLKAKRSRSLFESLRISGRVEPFQAFSQRKSSYLHDSTLWVLCSLLINGKRGFSPFGSSTERRIDEPRLQNAESLSFRFLIHDSEFAKTTVFDISLGFKRAEKDRSPRGMFSGGFCV